MNPYLRKSAALGPVAIERLLKLIPESQYDKALSPDRFTVRQVVAHLADWEPILRKRIEDALRTPGVVVEEFDEEQMAIDHRYSEQSLWDSMERWKRERAQTSVLLMELTDEDMQIPFIHPSNGRMFIGDCANMLNGHDLYHVEQLIAHLPR